MEKCLILDTSIASANKGDDIIMECVRKELAPILAHSFELTVPTHVSAFHWYQVLRNSLALQRYKNCRLKFVGGTNLLVKNLLTHYPQWNINLFNYQPYQGSILVGVGAGAGEKTNTYTRYIYRKLLNSEICHSVRDERTKLFLESIGIKAVNTGCATMWMLTPEFCRTIPTQKADNVVFTLTARTDADPKDQRLIDILTSHYNEVYYWVQGETDLEYLRRFECIDNIKIVAPTVRAYHEILLRDDIEYVGTRLHAGVYAMRHAKRAIILVIDERAREINKSNNLNCLEKEQIDELPKYIESSFKTEIRMPYDKIAQWKSQFEEYTTCR